MRSLRAVPIALPPAFAGAATALAALVLALAAATPALAGGWATVGLDSTPQGVAPGGKWTPDITVLQHGRTPLEGVEPAITIRNAATGEERRFAAKPTDKAGVYRAEVSFPAAGRWSYIVDDGFGNAGKAGHTFAPVTIGGADAAAPAAVPDDDSSPVLPIGLAVAALLLAGGIAITVRRRGGVQPA